MHTGVEERRSTDSDPRPHPRGFQCIKYEGINRSSRLRDKMIRERCYRVTFPLEPSLRVFLLSRQRVCSAHNRDIGILCSNGKTYPVCKEIRFIYSVQDVRDFYRTALRGQAFVLAFWRRGGILRRILNLL